jgi:hypothetical protein
MSLKKIIVIFIVMLFIGANLSVLGSNNKSKIETTSLDGGWIKHFEGASWGHTVIQTSDGGYLVGGGTDYSGNSDALLIKTDSEGIIEWETSFGNTFGWDAFEGLVETPDGGFVASGTKNAKGFLAKVDMDGNHLWEKSYGESIDGYCIDVKQTSDNGFILTGIYYSEPRMGWLIKTDSDGHEIWSKTFGGDMPGTLHSVGITSDGGFILSGWKTGMSWAIKTDKNGNIQWENNYDGVFNYGLQTSDGEYIFIGSIGKLLNLRQIYLMRVNSEGNELWNKNFGTPFTSESSLCIEETNDGGFVVIGIYLGIGTTLNYIQNNHFFPLWSKIWLLKTDSNGNVEWDNKIESGFGRCVKQTTDGGYILTGQKGAYNFPEGVLLIKTDENGNIG